MRKATCFAHLAAAALLLLAEPLTAGDDSSSPRHSDWRLSDTMVTVAITRRADGMHEYRYSLFSAPSNKGTIASFEVDIFCASKPGDATLTGSGEPAQGRNDATARHAPAQLEAGNGAFTPVISPAGWATWSMSVAPGTQGPELRIISPAPPGARLFFLRPDMSNSGQADAQEKKGSLSDTQKAGFAVMGLITGPLCASP